MLFFIVCKKMPSVMSKAFRRGSRYQIGWIFGRNPNGLWPPPPSFLENYVAIFFIMNMVAHMQGGMRPDSMKCMYMPSSKCFLFWFFSIRLLKNTYPEPCNYSFQSISSSKSPVYSSQILQSKFLDWKWPPPFATFPKIHSICYRRPSLNIQ